MASPKSKLKTDEKHEEQLDNEVHYEFGGPLGVSLIMFFSPVVIYYLWICLEFYDGVLQYPTSFRDAMFFADRMWAHVVTSARPTLYSVTMYVAFVVFEAIIALVLPGPSVEGLPVPSEGNRKLKYKCNGFACWWFTQLTAFILHYTGLFPLTEIIDNFGPLLSTAFILSNSISVAVHIAAIVLGKAHRMSGNLPYDFFMGAWLNPRIGLMDLKLFVEIRINWVLLFLIAVSAALKQKQVYGVMSPTILFMVMAHWLYANACHKGEECILTSWDVFYEKWGWMLIFWNMAGVPFLYCHAPYYLAKHPPLYHSTPYTVFLYCFYLCAYYVFDTANSQKNRFRAIHRGTYIHRRWAFPQLPWGTLKDPPCIKTANGNLLLTGGWFKYARKIHYTADVCQALSWGLICGFGSFIPYFYVCFFVGMLLHRQIRDNDRCSKKYRADWDRYCKTVPYVFIPGVY